ncbi:MAG: DUF2795 domain-containing protein [Dehalococcoidia bacterium]
MQRFLRGIDDPAEKQQLIDRAESQGAGDEVRRTLQRLPGGRFNSPNE